jgi:hypothetical protein
MTRATRRWALATTLAAAVTAPSCVALEAMDPVMVPGAGSAVSGELRSVDSRNGRLQVRDPRSNRTETLRYDGRTRVVYRGRQHPVSSLERGDLVRVRVSRDRSGTTWADHVEVERSVRDRDGASGRVERLEGTVRQVDTRRGIFVVDHGVFRATTVYLPRNAARDDVRRFDRLRRGERVRVEVRPLNSGVAELVRFR